MAVQRESVPGQEVAAVAAPFNQDSQNLFLLHAEPNGTETIRKNVRDVRRAISAAGIDPVEALRVAAGIIVDFELVVSEVELVDDLADRNTLDGLFLGFEVVAGKFKAVVPQRALAGAQLLDFFP